MTKKLTTPMNHLVKATVNGVDRIEQVHCEALHIPIIVASQFKVSTNDVKVNSVLSQDEADFLVDLLKDQAVGLTRQQLSDLTKKFSDKLGMKADRRLIDNWVQSKITMVIEIGQLI